MKQILEILQTRKMLSKKRVTKSALSLNESSFQSSFSTSESESEARDERIFSTFRDLLTNQAEMQKQARLRDAEESSEESLEIIKQRYDQKMDFLIDMQKIQIANLQEEWRNLHLEAELLDEEEHSTYINTINILKFSKTHKNIPNPSHSSTPKFHNNVKLVNSKYKRLFKNMLQRHQTELYTLKLAYQNDLILQKKQRHIQQSKIEAQYNVEQTENEGQLIGLIASTSHTDESKKRLIQTVSPKKQMRVGQRPTAQNNVFATPCPKKSGQDPL